MKALLLPLLIVVCSCIPERKSPEPIFVASDQEHERVYEGKVPINSQQHLHIELKLMPSVNGNEGKYELIETIEENDIPTTLSTLSGLYSSLHGNNDAKLILQLHNSALLTGMKRSYAAPSGRIREERFRNHDLMLERTAEDELIVLNNNQEAVSSEYQHKLWKRTSNLFTIEGYLEDKTDTVSLLEINTGEFLPVSKLGAYYLALRQYHELTSKTREKVYIKAVGYRIHRGTVVLKRIIQVSSIP